MQMQEEVEEREEAKPLRHIDCGGEVTDERDDGLYCHKCEDFVEEQDVTRPEERQEVPDCMYHTAEAGLDPDENCYAVGDVGVPCLKVIADGQCPEPGGKPEKEAIERIVSSSTAPTQTDWTAPTSTVSGHVGKTLEERAEPSAESEDEVKFYWQVPEDDTFVPGNWMPGYGDALLEWCRAKGYKTRIIPDEVEEPAPKPVPEANWMPPPPMTKTTVIFLQPEDWEWLVGRLRQQNKRISMLETVMVRLIGDSLDTMKKERSAGEVVEEQG